MTDSLGDAALDAAKKLADPLIAKAENALPDLVKTWVEAAIQKGQAYQNSLPDFAKPLAQNVITALQNHSESIASVSQDTFVKLVNMTAMGTGEDARLVYLATAASNEERFKALDDASAATKDEKTNRIELFQKVKAAAEDVALALVKAGLVAFI